MLRSLFCRCVPLVVLLGESSKPQEDDDEKGGIQQIVRCAMKTVAAACEAPCAALALQISFGHVLQQAVLKLDAFPLIWD